MRCWAHLALRIEVRADRRAPWLTGPLPRDGARLDEVLNSSLATLAQDGVMPASAHARFVFAAAR